MEFEKNLALSAYGTKNRTEAECLPECIMEGSRHTFLRDGQRIYRMLNALPLLRTNGEQGISKPLATIRISSVTHVLIHQEIWTCGIYQVERALPEKNTNAHPTELELID